LRRGRENRKTANAMSADSEREIPFEAVRTWVFEALLPYWAARGIDREHGGFLEELSPEGEATPRPDKRVRTLCRQIYVFSHAACLGWEEGAPLSAMGGEYLMARAALPGGGWAKTLSRQGAVTDATPDLYDLAFVLFALAWRYRLARESEVLAHLHATLDFIQHHMSAGEGFVSRLPDDGVRLQNPHMHLLEACLAAFEASGDERFLAQADALTALFRARLFDGATLGERFRPDWSRTPAQTLEPGHHFEWAWILAQYQRLRGGDWAEAAAALVASGERWGVDAAHAVYDAVGEDGAPLQASSRAWTNTERIKGWLGLYELTGRDPREAVGQSLALLFERYFAGAQPGAWTDRFDADGRPLTEAVPASIVYHLLLAFSEVLRLERRLRG
jgi:mannose/cellobiose epimerase-like protein (N-acyl-D-glucosamine 2-epimerase family)